MVSLKAPCEMHMGTAAVNGSVAYFLSGRGMQHTVLAYDSAKNSWSELPRCPNFEFSHSSGQQPPHCHWRDDIKRGVSYITRSLLSLNMKNWMELSPPPPPPPCQTKRCYTAVECSGGALEVAGGV